MTNLVRTALDTDITSGGAFSHHHVDIFNQIAARTSALSKHIQCTERSSLEAKLRVRKIIVTLATDGKSLRIHCRKLKFFRDETKMAHSTSPI